MTEPKDNAEPTGASGGSVAGDPFVWAVLDSRGTVVAYTCRETAEAYCNGTFNQMIPLYRQPHPTLIDEEREDVDTSEASLMRESTDLNTPLPVRQRLGAAAATLRGLLERLGGDNG